MKKRNKEKHNIQQGDVGKSTSIIITRATKLIPVHGLVGLWHMSCVLRGTKGIAMNHDIDMKFERVIFIHKHPTSARTRFLQFKDKTVCGFSPLPNPSQVLAYEINDRRPAVAVHPAVIIHSAAHRLALPEDAVELVPQYNVWVDTPDGTIRIHLLSFTAIDPPFAAAEAIGGNFIDLIEARNLPETELLLLRKAYEVLLGG